MAASTDPGSAAPIEALVGPTASGKSAVALIVAERAGAEIVSLDSMQVYRGMDVGTAKPSPADRARVRHHLLDVVEPGEHYDVQRFLRDVSAARADIAARGRRALLVGGTGLYLKAVTDGMFEGPDVDRALRATLERRAGAEGGASLHAELATLDPRAAARIHPNDVKRLVRALEVHAQTGRTLSDWQTQWGRADAPPRRLVGLDVSVAELDRRIVQRTRAMLDAGWAAEAARVRASGGFGVTSVQALGYATALALHDGRTTREEAERAIALATRQFARRQRTWFRKFPDVVWIPAEGRPAEEIAADVQRALGW